MPPTKKIHAKETDAHKRLDIFVSEKLKISRSQAQKLISDNRVTINGTLPKKAGDTVRAGDTIAISNPPRGGEKSLAHSPVILSEAKNLDPSLALRMTIKKPKIIAETPDYIVVNKPTGLLVHPTQAKEKNTLVSWLLKKYPEIKKVGDSYPPLPEGGSRGGGSVRPGIVHRLDKEASGLLVVARTQKMFNHLKNQFKNRTIEKEYWALVHGKVAKDWDVLEFPIARSENAERMAARPLKQSVIPSEPRGDEGSLSQSPNGQRSFAPTQDDNGEKDARTEFFVERRFVNFTLLKVILHTGRMHQIRVHMLAYNHPLVGDPLYTQKKQKRTWDKKLGRLFLHSAKLAFTDLDGDKHTFESELPKELEKFLNQLS